MRASSSTPTMWEDFVRQCAAALDAGVADREFALGYVGQRVTWTGRVERLDLKRGTIVPGVAVTMPWTEVPLKNGNSFVGSYVFLKLRGENVVRASAKRVGDEVTFAGEFPDVGVFSSVNFDADDEQRKVFLSMTLEDGQVLE